MKKAVFVFLTTLFIVSLANAQHFIPLKLMIYPDSLSMAFYGSLSMDRTNGKGLAGMSSTGQTGFVVNALYSRMGPMKTYHQFMVDFNPLLVNWDPFTWNKLLGQPIDSFVVYRVPYAEDALLHIGWRYNFLSKIYGKQTTGEFSFFNAFADIYYRPYKIVGDSSFEFRFSAVNINTGLQYSYVQQNVPVLGNFLIGVSAQLNMLVINEPDNNLHDFTTITKYHDKAFIGPGAKLIVQTNALNIYMELRQYWGMTTGEKFTQDAALLVGILGNLQWTSKRKNAAANKPQNEHWW